MANEIQKLIVGFLVLIVGIALIGSVASNSLAVTDKTLVYSESLDISAARTASGACPMSVDETHALALVNSPTGWKATDCPITSFSMLNQTGIEATVTTDYVLFANNGTLLLMNTTIWGDCSASANTTTLNYTYCADGYLNLSWGRTILNLVAGFFALALLGVSIGIFYSVAKDANLIK